MAATYPADTFQEGVDLTIEASNQLAQVVRGDANTEVMVADGSTIPSIRKAQADSMYFKEPEAWTTGQTETDYLQLKKYINPTTGKESWWFAKGALVSNPIAMGTSPFGDDNWTLYTPEDLFISGKAEYESVYQALKGKAAEAGYNLVRGSFEEGGTLTNTNDVLWYQANGKYYNWFNGSAKTVVAGSTPATSGGIGARAWIDRTDVVLRDQLAGDSGATKVGTSDGRTVEQRLAALPNEVDAAGTAASLIYQHNADYFAHPKLTEQIAAEVHRAEIAADVAQLSAGIYSSTSAGIAATTSGKYFSVPSADSDEYLILYKNDSGTAVEVQRYPSADRVKKVDLVSTKVDYEQRIYKNKSATNASETFARQKMDDIGDVPNSLQNKIYAAGGEVAIGSLDAAGKLIAGVGEMGLIAGNNSIQDREPEGSEVYAIVDDSSRASFVIREGGLVDVATRKPWDLPEVTHIISYGQSLSIGVKGTPIISTVQPYDNLMFNGGVQPGTDTANVTSLVPLVEQAQPNGGYETVLSGCCNKLSQYGNDSQFLGTATGVGNTPIASLGKGTVGYTRTLFARDPAKSCSANINKTYSMGAFLWLQGEADVSSMFSPFFPTQCKQYKAQLAQLWRDLNADFSDCNTIASAIPLISYQLSFNSLSVNAEGVTQAQLDVSNEFDHIYCAGPTYNLTYSEDNIHLSGPSYYIYGHYFARALNEIINGRDWKPLHIKSARRSGKGLLLKYHVPHGPLVIDPFKGVETTDHGFAVYDTNGDKLTISSVTAVTEDAIKILLSITPPGPVAIKYARDYSNGQCNGAGVATGDVRDSSDEIATYKISTTTYNVNLYNYACHQTIWSN